jgi:hypothetical protein
MDFKGLLSVEWVRYVVILFVGVTVGALFYPTKHIEEKLSLKYEQEISQLKETHQKEIDTQQEIFTSLAGEYHSYHDEMESKVSSLTTEVHSLQSKQKTAYYKIVRPDGTIEIKKFTESEVNESSKVVTQVQEEFKRKTDSIESKWKSIHETRVVEIKKEYEQKESNYKKTIEDLQKSKVTSVNEKRFGLEGGMMSNRDYYLHATADLWGPVFVGIQGEANKEFNENRLGLGLGLRF